MTTNSPFPADPVLTGITLAYRNRRMIADEVLPRLDPPFEKSEFVYHKLKLDEAFRIPDTKVGRRSEPNEVEFSSERLTDSTDDYGLDDLIPEDDFANSPDGFDPEAHATESLTDLVGLDREQRVATLVFNANTYPTANKKTLSGTDQWSDTANSKPIKEIQDAIDVPVIRPNIMTIGRAGWTTLIRHPDIVKAFHGNDGGSGIAQRAFVAGMFELEDILVGESFVNTAKQGQAATVSRVWGNHCALLYRDPLARGDQNRITFGFTAQFGERVAWSMPEPKKGLRGSRRVRVGESVKEVITASDVGYFLQNVI